MLKALGRLTARHPLRFILVWLVTVLGSFALALGVFGDGLFDRLQSESPSVPTSESGIASDMVEEADDSPYTVNLVLWGLDLTDQAQMVDVGAALADVRRDLADIDGVAAVIDPFAFPTGPADPRAAPLLSTDADGFIVRVELEDGLDEEAQDTARVAVEDRLGDVVGELGVEGAQGIVSNVDLITASVIDQTVEDLKRGEAFTLPLSLLVMVVVFGGFLTAGMPLVGAIAAIGLGMAAMWGAAHFLNVDSYVVNILSIMGLALSIDYGLLVVSRFREELTKAAERHRERPGRRRVDPAVVEAMELTLDTAGRTVLFSALIIAISISGLLLMEAPLLRTVGIAGVAVVLVAVASAVSLVPAHLALFGRRLLRPSVLSRLPLVGRHVHAIGDVAPDDGVFSRLARFVHRWPWLVLVPTLGLLGAMAFPLSGINLRADALDYVPRDSVQGQYLDIVDEKFPALQFPDVFIVVDADRDEAEAWAADIAQRDDVERVNPVTESGDRHLISMRLGVDSASDAGLQVVRDLRAEDRGFDFWVGGAGATTIDFADSLLSRLPYALGLVVVAVFVLLFLMTGSIVVPAKALVVNLLSLAASMGVTVLVFQEGHLAGLLDFDPLGGIELVILALAVAFGFGLAMDYEVFLLARIKEFWDATGDNDVAVERGLQKSGRIITSAALVMLLVFAGLIVGKLIAVKEAGFALFMTVLVDATLVRMLLVPSTMTILGAWNWWAPGPLRRLHDRFGVRH
ncbi:MAG: MMPL family transporter [Actinomycetales bacterium]|nr:MMPL family transporter [Actinomycetales bacterium]